MAGKNGFSELQHDIGDRRGMDEAIAGGFGRFGRMFPAQIGIEYSEAALEQLAETMIKKDDGQFFNQGDDDENLLIPAGYTYFGQFVDHDLTLDTTSIGERENDAGAIVNFRTPRLDLDSVYDRGPVGSPHLYDKDFALLVGANKAPPTEAKVQTRHDHIRGPDDSALIGDARNDENNLVAQMHTSFIAFHNKVIRNDTLMAGLTDRWDKFRRAAQIVRWHYQWVIVHDFLKKISQPDIYADITRTGSLPRLRNYRLPSTGFAFMPIEFSGAAYRFGHSMVRPGYALNNLVGTNQAGEKRIPIFKVNPDGSPTGELDDLRGFRALPGAWGIDWGYFLDLPGTPPAAQLGTGTLQPSYRIDTLLVEGLARLPDHSKEPIERQSLPFLNLLRGSMMRLPSAEQVASEMALPVGGIGKFPMMDSENIWSAGSRMADPDEPELKDLRAARAKLAPLFKDGMGNNHTPLWYYILREAEWYATWTPEDKDGKAANGAEADIFGGHHLGPMGSTIVLETFMAILAADPFSILHKPGWRPMAPIADPAKEFGLAQLIEWALT